MYGTHTCIYELGRPLYTESDAHTHVYMNWDVPYVRNTYMYI